MAERLPAPPRSAGTRRRALATVAVLVAAATAASAAAAGPGPPGDVRPMLLTEIAGHRYERQGFDPQGAPTGRAVIEIGELVRRGDAVELPLEVTAYTPEGEVEARLSSVWTCRPDQQAMVMPVLFLSETSGSAVRLDVEGDPILYPREPAGRLPDLDLKIKAKKGAFSFFGGRTAVRISGRRAAATADLRPGEYTITEEIELKVFVLGIRVKRIRLHSEEVIDPTHGLVRQILKAPDGSGSIIRLAPGGGNALGR